MARGWESKSVESQMEAAEQKPDLSGPKEDPAKARQRRGLELTRNRLKQDLARSSHPAHRQQLEAALAEVEAQIARLEPPSGSETPK